MTLQIMSIIGLTTLLGIPSTVFALSSFEGERAGQDQANASESPFDTRPMRFIGKSGAVTIPPEWKLISVSEGEPKLSAAQREIADRLWFQDGLGNVYVIEAAIQDGELRAYPDVGYLPASR